MIRRHRSARTARRAVGAMFLSAALVPALFAGTAQAADYPVTAQQRGTAQTVEQNGVPLSELAPTARRAVRALRWRRIM